MARAGSQEKVSGGEDRLKKDHSNYEVGET